MLFDAMTTNRPYRGSLSKETAVKELLINKWKQFDPAIVDLFIEILENLDLEEFQEETKKNSKIT